MRINQEKMHESKYFTRDRAGHISLGMLFSGYLSYGELARETCPLGGCSSLLGVPTCVYGFVMYTIIFIVSLLGLRG